VLMQAQAQVLLLVVQHRSRVCVLVVVQLWM
jgi:hypothetical protein